MLKLKRQTQKHCWSNGRISPCQGGGPGPIPGQCNFFSLNTNQFRMNDSLFS